MTLRESSRDRHIQFKESKYSPNNHPLKHLKTYKVKEYSQQSYKSTDNK